VKVALFSKAFLPNVGGVETSSAMLAETWVAGGHEVEVVTATPDPSPPRAELRYRVTRSWSMSTLRAAARAANRVVCNGYSRLGIVAARLEGRRPTVLHQGYQFISTDGLGFRDRTFHDFERLQDLKLAFAESPVEGLKGLAKMTFDGALRRVPRAISHVVPSAHVARRLGLDEFSVLYQPPNPLVIAAITAEGVPEATARARAYHEGDVVFFGRMVFEKGIDDLVNAFARFRAANPDPLPGRARPPRLVLHGEGPERERIVALVGALGLGADVELRPFLGGERLAAAARAASVVVVPSRWEEPGATIAVELFACGAAVIGSQAGAPGEIFAEHGRLFRNRDVDDLARQLTLHFVEGPRYPRPTGAEPWGLPSIRRNALALVEDAASA
jgi:glycosyltransferase involved in cell wall biosynthesis